MSESTQQNQDAQHLQLLSLFHFVCAGIVALFACFPIFHLIMGLMLVFSPQTFGSGHNAPPPFFGWLFVISAAVFILAGWSLAGLLAWSGRCLKRRTSYLYCLVIAGVACMFIPIGTALGVFTIIVLMRPSVKAIFNPAGANRMAAV